MSTFANFLRKADCLQPAIVVYVDNGLNSPIIASGRCFLLTLQPTVDVYPPSFVVSCGKAFPYAFELTSIFMISSLCSPRVGAGRDIGRRMPSIRMTGAAVQWLPTKRRSIRVQAPVRSR